MTLLHRCGDCQFYEACKAICIGLDENETFPEIGGCGTFQAADAKTRHNRKVLKSITEVHIKKGYGEMSEKMKPCPFCGSEKQVVLNFTYDNDNYMFYVECIECECHTNAFDTKEKAVKAWNKRTPEDNGKENEK